MVLYIHHQYDNLFKAVVMAEASSARQLQGESINLSHGHTKK